MTKLTFALPPTTWPAQTNDGNQEGAPDTSDYPPGRKTICVNRLSLYIGRMKTSFTKRCNAPLFSCGHRLAMLSENNNEGTERKSHRIEFAISRVLLCDSQSLSSNEHRIDP